MKIKPLTISVLSLFGVFGLYVATANPSTSVKPGKSNPRLADVAKVKQALKQAELQTPENTGEKKRVLVFSVTNGFRHSSIELGLKTMVLMAEESGAFDVVVSNELENFDAGKINRFDAICFLNTTSEVFMPHKKVLARMSPEEKQEAVKLDKVRKGNLMKFIEGGKGFIGIHAASDTFYDWAEYGEMLGGYFNGHPWRHSMEVSIKADEKNKDHALLNGVIPEEAGELRFKEEIYEFKEPYDSSRVTMLLRLDPDASAPITNPKPKAQPKRDDKDFGVSWVKTHGEGRVFYCSLGHNNHIFWNKNVLRHYYSGILYALGE